MKAATLHEIKSTLNTLSNQELATLCLRLARFKKENKELLTYLLYEAEDERAYIIQLKEEMNLDFAAIPRDNNLYLIKKTLRKILRQVSKYIRFTGSKTVEVETLIGYCQLLKDSGIPLHQSTALTNLYQAQLKKINKAILHLHEDLQYDYAQQMEDLS